MPPAVDIRALTGQYPALGILPRSFLLGTDFQDFAAELKGRLEVIRWTWYAFRAYAVAGQTQLTFFQQNQASATNGLGDTNLQVPGQMSGGEAMIIRNVRVVPIPSSLDAFVISGPAVSLQQWYNVLQNNCWLELKVGDKLYIQAGPLTLFPAGQGLGTFATANSAPGSVLGAVGPTNIGLVQNGHPSNMGLWEMDPPIYVPATRTLNVTANWVAAQAVTTAGRLGIMLDGWRVRLVQ